MPRSEEANRQVRDAQRARIVAAARRVFARRGAAATMSEVAREAGVSQGLAYRYFHGKDELVDALARQATEQTAHGLAEVVDGPGTAGERLRRLLVTVLQARRDRPDEFQLVEQLRRGTGAPPAVAEALRRQGEQFVDALRRLVVAAQEAGEIADDDPDQLVTALLAYLDGITRVAADRSRQGGRHPRLPDPAIALRLLTRREA